MLQPADHGESIYQLVPPKVHVQPKPPMFKSKIPDYPPTASTFHLPGTSHPVLSNMGGTIDKPVQNKSHSNFGKAPGGYKNDPNNYMKKLAKSCSVPCLSEVRRTNPEQLRPSHLKESKFAAMGGGGPPRRGEAPVMGLKSSKNFIVANAVEVILAAPKKPQETTKHFLHKEDYGKVPKYLTHIKRDIDNEFNYIRQLQEQQYSDSLPAVQPLDDRERQALLEGLKAKWERVNTDYQAQTHVSLMDTEGKVRRKERCEAELAQLEKDIERLSKGSIQVHLES